MISTPHVDMEELKR
jgi:hypothetical protein